MNEPPASVPIELCGKGPFGERRARNAGSLPLLGLTPRQADLTWPASDKDRRASLPSVAGVVPQTAPKLRVFHPQRGRSPSKRRQAWSAVPGRVGILWLSGSSSDRSVHLRKRLGGLATVRSEDQCLLERSLGVKKPSASERR